MEKLNIPEDVLFIIDTLSSNGFSAYCVGGCVRDVLMKKEPADWDICTNALTHQIIDTFKNYKIIETGIKHGTVTIIINNNLYEITTFRKDGKYTNMRHPESVSFVDDIKDDLSRRDFTINALSYNHSSRIIDLFSGIEDLKNKVIRCINNPDTRFFEDALRIMRAIRFSAVLGFCIEENTKLSVHKNKNLLKNISMERISCEFLKIILCKNFDDFCEYNDVFYVFLNNQKPFTKNFQKILYSLPDNLIIRLLWLTIFLTDKNEIYAKELLKNLKIDGKTIKNITDAIFYYDSINYDDIKAIRRTLSKTGFLTFSNILSLKYYIYKNKNESDECQKIKNAEKLLKIIKDNDLAVSVGQLKISGKDLINSGITDGKKIGMLLDKLLDMVIDEKTKNTKKALLSTLEDLK